MDEREQARIFQRVKSLTTPNFIAYMNHHKTEAYGLGITHMEEAMSCHKRISRPMIEEVLKKAEQIRTEWDDIEEITVDTTGQYLTPEEIMRNMSPTELAIFKLETDAHFEIGGRTFYIKPVEEAKAQ
ncbi:hypothetical protein [Cryptosporangium minutisporangium]|uniref:hypothetical protein n=1 Tax=Cryptosporangium minutisporangium TaxID=113569 RepID=UPI0035E508F5